VTVASRPEAQRTRRRRNDPRTIRNVSQLPAGRNITTRGRQPLNHALPISVGQRPATIPRRTPHAARAGV
jgi:hypothetical protein